MDDYLQLVTGLCRLQQALLDNPPAPTPFDLERLRRNREHDMPPLAYNLLAYGDAWLPWPDTLFVGCPVPASATVDVVLEQLRGAGEGQRKTQAVTLLNDQFDLLPAALALFLGAALQVAWSHQPLGLEEDAAAETESRTLCSACGPPPMARVIHQGDKGTSLRYLGCSLYACG